MKVCDGIQSSVNVLLFLFGWHTAEPMIDMIVEPLLVLPISSLFDCPISCNTGLCLTTGYRVERASRGPGLKRTLLKFNSN